MFRGSVCFLVGRISGNVSGNSNSLKTYIFLCKPNNSDLSFFFNFLVDIVPTMTRLAIVISVSEVTNSIYSLGAACQGDSVGTSPQAVSRIKILSTRKVPDTRDKKRKQMEIFEWIK